MRRSVDLDAYPCQVPDVELEASSDVMHILIASIGLRLRVVLLRSIALAVADVVGCR